MKLTIENPSAFLEVFSAVSRVAPPKSPLAVMQSVLVRADGDDITLTATDREVTVERAAAGAKVIEGGDALLPAGKALALFKGMNHAAAIEVEGDGKSTTLKGKGSRFTLPTEDPATFPDVRIELPEEPEALVTVAEFKAAIRRAGIATDENNTRWALGGLLIEAEKGALNLVGTDGRRLARASIAGDKARAEKALGSRPVVPVKALKALGVALGDSDDDGLIGMSFAANVGVFSCGDMLFSARLVEGQFPPYQKVYPQGRPRAVATVLAGPLRAAVALATVTTSVETQAVEFALLPGLLTLSSQAADVGSGQVECPVEYNGPPVAVRFSGPMAVQGLESLDPEAKLTLRIDGPESAAVISMESFDYLLMPMGTN